MKERERGRESRYVLWVSNDGEREKKIKSSTRGRNVEGEVLRQNKKTRGEKKCERVLQGNRDSVTSKKPVAADKERGADPVAPPLWVNNHHKPWLCLMKPLPMS